MNGWTKIYTSRQLFEVELIKGNLEEHGIEAMIMNQVDSAYGTFGEVQLFVQQNDTLRAIQILKNTPDETEEAE